MKAVALYGKEDLRPIELSLPALGLHDLRVRVRACGICGSDLRMYFKGPTPRYKLPTVLGHEIAAEVVEVGGGLADYAAGDLVSIAPIVPCMRCAACSRGLDNLCENGQVIGTTIQGGFAEMMHMPAAMVLAGGVAKIPAGVSYRAAALSELVGCCLHGLRQLPLSPMDRVLIIGDGPIGLTFLQLAQLAGAGRVMISGRRPRRRDLAAELGADDVLDASAADLRGRFDRGLDVVIVATSNPDVPGGAVDLVRPGGHLLLFSGYVYGTSMNLDLNSIHYREIHIHGSIDAPIRDFRNAVALLPKLHMERLVSASYPLERAAEGFQAAQAREAVKLLLEP